MTTLVGNDLYTQLGSLIEYPRMDVRPKVDAVIDLIKGNEKYQKEIADALEDFRKGILDMPLDELQGVYTYTFEMSSDYSLDLGFHLHEGFKRAENLLQIKAMFRHFEFPFETIGGGELPDHLPLVLKFLGFLRDEEAIKDLRINFLIKALERLNKNFEKNQKNPYRPLINAICKIIDKDIKEEVK